VRGGEKLSGGAIFAKREDGPDGVIVANPAWPDSVPDQTVDDMAGALNSPGLAHLGAAMTTHPIPSTRQIGQTLGSIQQTTTQTLASTRQAERAASAPWVASVMAGKTTSSTTLTGTTARAIFRTIALTAWPIVTTFSTAIEASR